LRRNEGKGKIECRKRETYHPQKKERKNKKRKEERGIKREGQSSLKLFKAALASEKKEGGQTAQGGKWGTPNENQRHRPLLKSAQTRAASNERQRGGLERRIEKGKEWTEVFQWPRDRKINGKKHRRETGENKKVG